MPMLIKVFEHGLAYYSTQSQLLRQMGLFVHLVTSGAVVKIYFLKIIFNCSGFPVTFIGIAV